MKYLIAASLVIFTINASCGQTKLGLKLTSSVITQRISSSFDSIDVSHGANAFVPIVSLFVDLPLSRNYYFSTGVGYLSKRVNLVIKNNDDHQSKNKGYNIQYVQLPATLKLYTNEVALDKKIYMQFGPVFEIAVHTKDHHPEIELIDKIQPVDISLLFAAGMEFQLAPNTALQVGLSYSRGLVNIGSSNSSDLIIKNDLYGIDIAIKF